MTRTLAEPVDIPPEGAGLPPSAPNDVVSSVRRGPLVGLGGVTGALLALAAAVTYSFWPGHMSSDTLSQIASVRSGDVTNWHAGVLIAIWRPVYELGVGVTAVFFLSVCTFVLGLYSVLRCISGRLASCVATAVIVASPPVLGYVGYFGRDQWFTALVLGACGSIALAARSAPGVRRACLIVALVGLVLLGAARQNGIAFGAGIAIAWVRVAGVSDPLARRGGRVASLTSTPIRKGVTDVALGVVLALSTMVVNAGVSQALGVRDVAPEQATYLADLATMSVRRQQVLLPPKVFPAQDLSVLEQRYNPYGVGPLLFGEDPPVTFPLKAGHVAPLREAWKNAVLDDPVDWFRGRWHLWTRQIGWSGNVWWVYHPYVDANPWGYEIEHQRVNDAVQAYLGAFTGDPWLGGGNAHKVWVWLLLAASGTWAVFSRSLPRQVIGWLCVGALAYASTVFVAAMTVQYRFSFPVVVVGMVAAWMWCHLGWRFAVTRRRGSRHATHPSG